MRVKIDGVWHDSNEEPICIQISENEQQQIASVNRVDAPSGKYAIFPGEWEREDMLKWMEG